MNLSRLRLLTFDVTGTLLKFKTPPAQQYGEIGAMYGVMCDDNSLATNFKAQWRKMSKEYPNYGLDSGLGWERWWKELIVGTFKDTTHNVDDKKLDAIASHLIHAYTTSTYWKRCYGALDLLSYLRHKRIPLGVVSNYDPRLDMTLRNAKIRHYFKFVITSYEVGIEKPDRKIFEQAMVMSEIKDLKPKECFHVGDTADLDYEAAKGAGWHAALILNKNLDKEKRKHVLDHDHIFATLYDFHKYLVDSNGEKLIVQNKN